MHIHILTLFPESIRPYLDTSIMKRAQDKGLFRYTLYNLADWTVKNTRRVDDRPYGGGAGTIITIEPLTYAIRDILDTHGGMPIFVMDPAGDILTQHTLSTQDTHTHILIICGHYEGIDARIYDLFSISRVSIGSYVVSSGELASLVYIDALVRLIPGVIAEESLREESFSDGLDGKKEYPQYSRPQVFEGLSVPDVLLSGDHEAIQIWKKSMSHS